MKLNLNQYKYNVISIPGLLASTHATQTTALVNNTIGRGDKTRKDKICSEINAID